MFRKTPVTMSSTKELRGKKMRNAGILIVVIALLMFVSLPDGYELVGALPPILVVISVFFFIEKKEVSTLTPVLP